MPTHGRSRRHESPARENRRRSRHHSSHHSSSSESHRSRGTPGLSRSSSEMSRSGDSSGRSSRASDIVMNLFGIRSRRDWSSSGSPPQSTFADDVFARSSGPSYARDNTAYGNMPPNKGKGIITTAPVASGASYALSNIPAQMYYLQPNHQQAPPQPQQHQMGRNYADENSHGNLGYMGQTAPPLPSPTMPYQAQYTSPYYPYLSSNMCPWQQQTEVIIAQRILFLPGLALLCGKIRALLQEAAAIAQWTTRLNLKTVPSTALRAVIVPSTALRAVIQETTTAKTNSGQKQPETEGDGFNDYDMTASSISTLRPRDSSNRDGTYQTFHDSDESGSMSTITEQTYRARVPCTPSRVSETVKASKEPPSLPSSHRKAPDRGFLRRPKHTMSPPFSVVSSIASTPRGSYKKTRGYRPPTVESIVDSDDDSSVYKIAVAEDIEQIPPPKTRILTKERESRKAGPPASSSCCSKCSQPIGHDEKPSPAGFDHPPSTLSYPKAPTPNEDVHQYKDGSSARNSPTGSATHSVSKPLHSGEDENGSLRPSRQASTTRDTDRGGSHDASNETYPPSQRYVSSDPRTFSVHTASPPTTSEQPGQQYACQSDEQSYDYVSRTSQSPPQHAQDEGSWPDIQSHLVAEQHQGLDGHREEGKYFQRAKDFFTKGQPYPPFADSQTMANDEAHDVQDQPPKETPPYDFSRLFGAQSVPKTNAYYDLTPGHSASFTDADVHALYDRVPSFSRADFGGNNHHGYDDDSIHGCKFGPFPSSDSPWEHRDTFIDDDSQGFNSNHEDEDEDEDDELANHFANTDDESCLVLWENPIVEDNSDSEFASTASHKGKTASPLSPKERVQGSLRRSTSSLKVAEYNGSDSDSDSGSTFSRASTVRVKKYNRMVECEVASISDDESERPHSPVRIRCRASVRATQIDY
ncbi:hypothetical protein F503_04504 [Ophiostoma piceae UAMH 11346]|uniref:Uncharacterized protein n=1 Tax=Ophiostoma piceae (strain UAMH 11346) TaxID=1262450 RepID=S3C7W1_OPHP1|nr:hypothetical protein F503_04504 [Ophiostoma piceae UAMH 11346]